MHSVGKLWSRMTAKRTIVYKERNWRIEINIVGKMLFLSSLGKQNHEDGDI